MGMNWALDWGYVCKQSEQRRTAFISEVILHFRSSFVYTSREQLKALYVGWVEKPFSIILVFHEADWNFTSAREPIF
jgi:hypothetical protein